MWRNTDLTFEQLRSQCKTASQIQMPLLQEQQTKQCRANFQSKQISNIDDVLRIKRTSKSKFLNFCRYLQERLPPLHPESDGLLLWNLLMLLLIFYNFIVPPIFILIVDFYQGGYYDQKFIDIDIFIVILFSIDMIAVRSRVSFYKNQKLITSYQLIYQKYLSFQFFLDILTLLGYIIYIAIPTQIYIKLFLILKIYAYIDLNEKVQKKLIIYPYSLLIYKFFRLVAFAVIITNLAGCIYFALDYSYYREQSEYYEYSLLWLTGSQTTFQKNLIKLATWPTWYDYTMYYSVQTIAGCGYGNITPRNAPQVLFCNIIMLTFFAMYTYFRSKVYAIFSEVSEITEAREESMREYHAYIDENEVTQSSKDKGKTFIESYLRRSYQDERQTKISQILSQKLKIEMKLAFNSEIYQNLPIMAAIFHTEQGWTSFAKNVIQCMKVKYLSAGDVVFEPKQTTNFKLIQIIRGTIKSTNPFNQNEKFYQQWSYIGQRQFFFQSITTSQVKCQTFTKFCYFQRGQFYQIIKGHQEQNETLRQAVEGVYIDAKQGKQFELECIFCEQSHFQYFCEIRKWRKRLYNISNKAQEKQHLRQLYNRRRVQTKKIVNLDSVNYLQVDRYFQSKKYHSTFNLKVEK